MLALVMTASRVPARAADPAEPLFRERWVYCSTNLLVDQNVDRVLDLIERARRSGYTAIMLADYKFQILDRIDERYFRNAERVKTAAARAGLEIIPAVFSIEDRTERVARPWAWIRWGLSASQRWNTKQIVPVASRGETLGSQRATS